MKKLLISILLMLLIFTMGCGERDDGESAAPTLSGTEAAVPYDIEAPVSNVADALRFKIEYEDLNGDTRSNGEPFQILDIPNDNPVVYLNPEQTLNMMRSGTGVIYLGFSNCPWCRELVPMLLDTVNGEQLPLYYLNMQSLRDVMKLDDDGELVIVEEGIPEYHDMVNILYNWLWEYIGLDEPAIKRIYVPTTVFVKNGIIQNVHLATLEENYRNGYIPLDEDQQKQVTDMLKDGLNKILDMSDCTETVAVGC